MHVAPVTDCVLFCSFSLQCHAAPFAPTKKCKRTFFFFWRSTSLGVVDLFVQNLLALSSGAVFLSLCLTTIALPPSGDWKELVVDKLSRMEAQRVKA